MKSKQLILLGPPGSGLADQAIVISKTLACASCCGKMICGVPDQDVMLTLRRRLEQLDMLDGWVLEGFPQNANASAKHLTSCW